MIVLLRPVGKRAFKCGPDRSTLDEFNCVPMGSLKHPKPLGRFHICGGKRPSSVALWRPFRRSCCETYFGRSVGSSAGSVLARLDPYS